MASTSFPSAAQSQPRELITPLDQMDRLYKEQPPGWLENSARPIADEISASKMSSPDGRLQDIPGVAKIIAEYAVALSSNLANWHTDLELSGNLPKKIPALPPNVTQLLNDVCPILNDKIKPIAPYKYSDIWSLGTTGTVNEESIKVSYEITASDTLRECRVYLEPYWKLHPNKVLPVSLSQTDLEKVQMISELSAQVFANFSLTDRAAPSFSLTDRAAPSLGTALTVSFYCRDSVNIKMMGRRETSNELEPSVAAYNRSH